MASSKKHPILIYRRLYGAWRTTALLIALGSGVLWWRAPAPVNTPLMQAAFLTISMLAGLLYVYTVVGPALSYVKCLPNRLLLSTPLYRLVISYRRIHTLRPVMFSPQGVRWTKQWLIQPYVGRTALAVDLNGYPVERRFLQLWLNEFVLPSDFLGLVLVTPDWMALSRDIESHRSEWKMRRKDAERDKNPLTSLSARKY